MARGPQPSRSRRMPPTSKRPTNIPLPRSRRKPPISRLRTSPSRKLPAARRRHPKHGPWTTFPYPILCVIVFLLAGFFLSAWHPAWVVFLTIPLYYWIANVIENDPVYRERTER